MYTWLSFTLWTVSLKIKSRYFFLSKLSSSHLISHFFLLKSPHMLTSIILIHLSLDNVISITDGQCLLLLAKLNWDRRALNTIWLSPYGLEGLFRNYHNYANLISFYYLCVHTIFIKLRKLNIEYSKLNSISSLDLEIWYNF